MQNKVLLFFSYLASGFSALAVAVYIASVLVRPSESAITLAQNTETQESQDQDLEVAPTDVRVNRASKPAPAFLEPYLYDTREGRRNPFRPFAAFDAAAYSDIVIGPSTPLERYDLDELKLTGILWDVKNPRAMFVDPKKEVHIVSKDDRIGRRRGYVAVIREGEVVVVETTTYSGEPVYSTRVLQIER